MGIEAELLCHFAGNCLDSNGVYHKSILPGARLTAEVNTRVSSTYNRNQNEINLNTTFIRELQSFLNVYNNMIRPYVYFFILYLTRYINVKHI